MWPSLVSVEVEVWYTRAALSPVPVILSLPAVTVLVAPDSSSSVQPVPSALLKSPLVQPVVLASEVTVPSSFCE